MRLVLFLDFITSAIHTQYRQLRSPALTMLSKYWLKDKYSIDRGFTLIELLIVIIIIGILAAVLIAVIDPIRQQNRARNAAIRSAIQKVAYSINTARSSTGRLPYENDIETETENVVINPDTIDLYRSNPENGGLGNTTVETEVLFDFPGVALPSSCNETNWDDAMEGTTQCVFQYNSGPIRDGKFRIIAKSWELTPDMDLTNGLYYVFDSSDGLWECSSAPSGLDPSDMSIEDFSYAIEMNGYNCDRFDDL